MRGCLHALCLRAALDQTESIEVSVLQLLVGMLMYLWITFLSHELFRPNIHRPLHARIGNIWNTLQGDQSLLEFYKLVSFLLLAWLKSFEVSVFWILGHLKIVWQCWMRYNMALNGVLQILQLTGSKELLIIGNRWTSINAGLLFDHGRDHTRVHVIRLGLIARRCGVRMSIPHLNCFDIWAHTDSLSSSIRRAAHWRYHRFIWLLSFSANWFRFVILRNWVIRLLFDIAPRDSRLSGLLLDCRIRGCIWDNFWRLVVLGTSVSCSYAFWCNSPVLLILLDFQLRLCHCVIRLLLRRLKLRLLAFTAAAKLWCIFLWFRGRAACFLLGTVTVTVILYLCWIFCTWLLQLHCSVTKFVCLFLNLNFDFVLYGWWWCLIVVYWIVFGAVKHRVWRIDIDNLVTTTLCHDFCLIVISLLSRSSPLPTLLPTHFISWNTRR